MVAATPHPMIFLVLAGVAFADSVTGGFSTSVAVFCHELPHEMGNKSLPIYYCSTVTRLLVFVCKKWIFGLGHIFSSGNMIV